MGKVVTLRYLENKKFRGRKVVLVGGTFDILNIGHVKFLKRCKAKGDVLIVGIASDRNVKERKGVKRPIVPQRPRAQMLASVVGVDYVFISYLSAYDPRIIGRLKPNVVVLALEKGKFSKRKKYKQTLEGIFPEIKVELPYSPSHYSTTKIIEKILRVYR